MSIYIKYTTLHEDFIIWEVSDDLSQQRIVYHNGCETFDGKWIDISKCKRLDEANVEILTEEEAFMEML